MMSFISNNAFDYFFSIEMMISIPFALALASISFLRD